MLTAFDFYYAELNARGHAVEPEKIAELDATSLLAREFYNQSILDGVQLAAPERLKLASELAVAWEKKVADFAAGLEAALTAKCAELGVSLEDGMKLAGASMDGPGDDVAPVKAPGPSLSQAPKAPLTKTAPHALRGAISRNPLAAAGIAAGVGFLGSRLLSKD